MEHSQVREENVQVSTIGSEQQAFDESSDADVCQRSMADTIHSMNDPGITFDHRVRRIRRFLRVCEKPLPLRHLSGDAKNAAFSLVDSREARMAMIDGQQMLVKGSRRQGSIWNRFI